MGSAKIYGDDSCLGKLQRQSLARDWGAVAGVGVGKSGKSGVSHGKPCCACWCKSCLYCV